MPTLELQALPVSFATATATPTTLPVAAAGLSYSTAAAIPAANMLASAAGVSFAAASGMISRLLTVSASPASYAVGTMTMNGTVSLAASPLVSYAVATGEMSGLNRLVSAAPTSYLIASAVLSGNAPLVTARPLSYGTASGSMGGSAKAVSANGISYAKATATLTGASDERGLSVCEVMDEAMNMWGIFNRCSAPEFAKEAAINIINASMQMVWNNANERNYWSKSTLTLTFGANATSQNLPDDVQNVVGPCRLSTTRRPLAPIGTIGELETFSDLYLDGQISSEPVAYHIERVMQSGYDPAKAVLHITPAPLAETSVVIDIVREAPRYSMGDLVACPVIPIPHRYVETLLLPIVRYQSSLFYMFSQDGQKETIDREYQQARVSLGMADPLPGKSGDNLERREDRP